MKKGIGVRLCRDADIAAISRLYYDTVRRVNSRDYDAEQIRAWAPGVAPEAFWRERFRSRRVFVAEIGGEVAGFAEFEPAGHVDCFYVHHRRQRLGVGSRLMARIEKEARAAKAPKLFAEVSLTARPFFEAMGFAMVEEAEKEHNGCRFRLFLLEKRL